MEESSRRGGGKGKSVVPPTRDVSPLNIQDLDFLFDDDENTLQEVEVQATHQQSQGTQGSTSIPSTSTVSMGGRSKLDIFIKHFDKVTLSSGDLQTICKYCSKSYKWVAHRYRRRLQYRWVGGQNSTSSSNILIR
ncbi:ATP-dependent zinc metalloprotease FTSH 1, chloroplastic-like [Dorcoceras hygrometricum]|uniref:ATP-dependent zinc metalloprotease FTSH 1, chloroplastic-like n=1 Tax=Dorcoceras hygrometricum TaxID=472368 RepID=A0A2Z7CPR9_9LAMI|nr:ATP-dependent zinc metalloprotease FTSH 1, chloroplastic-like [Dorcoceras hygrometricum]